VARRKAKGQNFRKSLMMKAGDFKAALLTNELPSSVNRVMIVRGMGSCRVLPPSCSGPCSPLPSADG